MLIIPAIDLIGGRCVRLVQGDYGRRTTYDGDPVDVAASFLAQGAEWLHVVDLEGAKQGRPANLGVVERIARSVPIAVELGGGITSDDALSAALDAGVRRVILGSALVRDPAFARRALALEDRVVCGLDAKDRRVAVGGWLETSGADVVEFGARLQAEGARRFILTDIARDGTLSGPNLELLKEFMGAVSVPVVQSGGVAGLDDVRSLAAMAEPPEGVIIGKAIYDGLLTVAEAIAAAG